MKTNSQHFLVSTALVSVAAVLLLGSAAHAQISGINSANSWATIQFDDTNSIVPPAGVTNVTQGISPWSGVPPFALVTPPDPNTLDFATGDITATFAGANYMVLPNNVQLSQVNATSGFALLIFQFTVEYTLASALPLQATLFPNFLVSGTVGLPAGSFAAVNGTIDYYDYSNAAYVGGLLDTVTYNYLNTTPGAFVNAPVNGVPTNGFTPIIPLGSNLTLVKGMGIVAPGNFAGRYIHYGIREHGMAAAMNGIGR